MGTGKLKNDITIFR